MWRSPFTWLVLVLCVILVIAVKQLLGESKSLEPVPEQPTASLESKLPSQVSIFPADPALNFSGQISVTIVEFGDFQCSYCADMVPILESAVKNTPGVKLVWKDLPLSDHDKALAAAEAAECAGNAGKFWEYQKLLYQNQNDLSDELYYNSATKLGLDPTSFTKCYKEHQTLPLIRRNIAEAQAIGVDTTPYFIVNGIVHNGSMSADELNALIQQAATAK